LIENSFDCETLNVKYRNPYIILSLKDLHNKEAIFNDLKSVYVNYKIKLGRREVQNTVSVKKRDISLSNSSLVLKIELEQLYYPENCVFEIVYLQWNRINGKKKIILMNKIFSFLEIQSVEQIFKPKTFKATPELQNNLVFIKETTNVSTIVTKIESKIERKLDTQKKKLELDITKLCYETIDLLFTALPQPELAEEYRASNAMVQSIHRYINANLLQNEFKEERSA